jgi:hypothetical protein
MFSFMAVKKAINVKKRSVTGKKNICYDVYTFNLN